MSSSSPITKEQLPSGGGTSETFNFHRPALSNTVPNQEEWRRAYHSNFQPPWISIFEKESTTTPTTHQSQQQSTSPPPPTPSSPPPLQNSLRVPNKKHIIPPRRTSNLPPPSSRSPKLGLPQGQKQFRSMTTTSTTAVYHGNEGYMNDHSDSGSGSDENDTVQRLQDEVRRLKEECARKDAEKVFLQKDLDIARDENRRLEAFKEKALSVSTKNEENDRLKAEIEQLKEKYASSDEYMMLLEKKVFHLTSIKFSMEKTVARLTAQLRDQEEAFRTITAKLKQENDQVIKELVIGHEKVLNQVRQDYEDAIIRLKESFVASSGALRETSESAVNKIKENQDNAIIFVNDSVAGKQYDDDYSLYKAELEPLAEVDRLIERVGRRFHNTESEKNNPWLLQYTKMCSEGKNPFQLPEAALTPTEPPGMNISQLVDMAVSSYSSDTNFVPHLLMMYRTFTDALTLFKTIAAKYIELCNINCEPEETDENDEDDDDNSMDNKIAMRGIMDDLIFRWTKLYPLDFNAKDFKALLMIFANVFVTSTVYRSSIINFITNPTNSTSTPVTPSRHSSLSSNARAQLRPQSLQPSATGLATGDLQGCDYSRPITSFEPEDIAHQIIFDDSKVFSHITLKDMLDVNKAPSVPSIKALSNRFNWLSGWVQTEIVTKGAKERAACIKHIVRIGGECLDNNDFLAAVAIGNAFDTAAVSRMKSVTEILEKRLNEKERATFTDLRTLSSMGNNYKNVRQAMSSATLPVVPFFAVYLRDFVFINDGNPSVINGGINFAKKRMFAEKYQEIIRFQSVKHSFVKNLEIENWMTGQKVLSSQECLEKSKEAEPHDTK